MAEEPDRWESVYQSKEEAETSWFEGRPQVSLDLIAATGEGKEGGHRRCRRGVLSAGGLPTGPGVSPDHRARPLGNRSSEGSRATAPGGAGRMGGGERPALAALRTL